MYRCVRITSPDDYLQCILWRENPMEDVKTYKLETVTYGTRPASFLAIRAMHQLANDEAESYPLGAQIVLRDFYVDDMITGSDTAEEAIEIMGQTSQLLAKGNFKIRKWCSNDQAKPTKITKRSALSIIARLYDPLGLVGPFVLKAKIFLQRLWMEKLDWDESLPMSHETSWENLCSQFNDVKHLTFPRFIAKRNASLELHAFCDASLSAYSTCVYIRASNGKSVCINLLCSKSRVAPIKSLTVPKLELCAAYLLAQLVHSIAQLNIFSCMFYCWSDSSIVLSWLKEDSSRFNVFVANRINNIQNLTDGMEWRYVPTAVNRADILSRGATPTELLNSSLWKHGPPFLSNPHNEWPKCCVRTQELPEMRKTFLLTTRSASDMSINCKYVNSFASMQRIYGYVYKFVKKDISGHLTPSHIQNGTYFLIRMIQMFVALVYISLSAVTVLAVTAILTAALITVTVAATLVTAAAVIARCRCNPYRWFCRRQE
ncbi:uncharacterized protein LOC129250357 [Anastrepha obliqua]|uniref:uncharacterized protein LOC129250357 n=1 Tax=Anastrepha obliqua TaxID=95512 RepID=UPI00240A0963|nr:uncharacterized protein LOC129250357 [Anastrepha obliqua]